LLVLIGASCVVYIVVQNLATKNLVEIDLDYNIKLPDIAKT
jgi:hypothetical protein